ncbi:MAG: GerMN domain-containing protein, partial [Pseudonocardia sp.]|nr:GerMN domain-containing protein [Pseudonocardia sp.]
ALVMLVAGPTPREQAAGLRTALPAQPDAVRAVGTEGGTVVVEIGVDVTRLPDHERLLAVAQVVWTATEALGVERVRFRLGGRPVLVPTDAGPTTGPLRRTDVSSVAPR